MQIPQKTINEIIRDYHFIDIFDEKGLKTGIVNMIDIVTSNTYKFYNNVSNKVILFDELVSEILSTRKDDMNPGYFLGNLMQCGRICWKMTNEQILYMLKDEIKEIYKEWKSVIVFSVAEAADLLEIIDGKIVLPEKWCSPKLYKKLNEFLKTFDCERTKIKKRVAYTCDGEFTPEQIIHICKQLNNVSLSDKFDFYPTPQVLVDVVQELADVKETDTVLEPSAGTGSLVKGLPVKQIDCIELNETLATILKEKGYDVQNCAFEDAEIKQYDKIIMNPPFSKRLDAKHIKLAFDKFLKDGGTLVAIHSSRITQATDKASKQFQELFSNYGTYQKEFNDNEFKNSGKGTTISTTITRLQKL